MFDSDQYQLLDFGAGEKVESFGGVVVRRQTPSVTQGEQRPAPQRAEVVFKIMSGSSESGTWAGEPPRLWPIKHGRKSFLLKPTPAGQVGIFPEQCHNWKWIETNGSLLVGKQALNLFAYTGGTTMSLASQGALVTHIDAANNIVKWAKKNAETSGLGNAPIRWIAEDAMKFVNREIKRGSRYDILVADPPTYGKGPKNETWRFNECIEPLLKGLSLLAKQPLTMLILSCHTPGFHEKTLLDLVSRYFKLSCGKTETMPLELLTPDLRVLGCGHCVRYAGNADEYR